jgi:catechol 2,3-dioxygenase
MMAEPDGKRIVPIHPDTQIGAVTLRVARLERSLRFYEEVVGFKLIEKARQEATLGAEGTGPLLRLLELPGAKPMPQSATGLFHFAILVPTRADLGRSLRQLVAGGVQIGQSDHAVSEALYASDPDGNGIEIYWDRPASMWEWTDGVVKITIDPLDLRGLMDEGMRDRRPWTGLPAGTRIGHVHLQVSDTQTMLDFYHEVLGFQVTSQFAGAVFAAAGGYHHHFAANSWNSAGSGPAPAGTAGLESFVVELPNREEQARLAAQLGELGVPFSQENGELRVRDPWENLIVFAVRPLGLR